MDRIIDAHVHIEVNPHTPTRTFAPEHLIARMDGPFLIAGEQRRVDLALAQPSAELTVTPGLSFREQHAVVIDACRSYPERVAGVFTFNPRLNLEHGVAELERLVREERFRAIKLHPTFHAVHLKRSDHLLHPVLDAARSLGIAVLIHTGEPPFSLPLYVAPLADAFPDVRIVIAHMGVQRLSFADEATEVARTHDNVWLEISGAQLNVIKESLRVLGAGKFMLGTDSPHHDIGAYLRMIEVLCHEPPVGLKLSESDREQIYGGNAAEVFAV